MCVRESKTITAFKERCPYKGWQWYPIRESNFELYHMLSLASIYAKEKVGNNSFLFGCNKR